MSKRATHGQYNREKKLPNNSLQPTGSGTNVWLLKQILNRMGQEQGQRLIEQAREHGPQRYNWLAAEMSELGHLDLEEEYTRRKKQDTAIKAYKEHQRRIEGLKQRILDEAMSGQRHIAYLEREMTKNQRYLNDRPEIAALIETRKQEIGIGTQTHIPNIHDTIEPYSNAIRLSPGIDVFGMRIAPGREQFQEISIINESPDHTMTFADDDISNVSDSEMIIIRPRTARIFVWDGKKRWIAKEKALPYGVFK